MEKLLTIIDKLAQKYSFTDEEIAEIQDALFADEELINGGEEYAADDEEDISEE